MIKTCIYIITNPKGSVYIGQTWNWKKREKQYRYFSCKNQVHIYNSLLKYGFENHKIDFIDLPKDVTQEVLDQYETFYWKQYKECGFKIMNIREPGSRGRLSEITKFKIKEKRKFFRHTEESKLKMRRPRPNMVGKATKSVICVNNRKVYGSISEAAEKLNLKQGDISNVLIGNQNTTKGYKFIYEKKENSVIRR